jgi:predicted alpha/beta-fold hydrolase
MPLICTSTYKPNLLFKNSHLNTIYPTLIRKVNNVKYQRQRIQTSDGDFLDLDFSKVNSNKLIVVLHGLESSSEHSYIKGIVKIFNQQNYDALAVNFRGCSGEDNNLVRSYHSGDTNDLKQVINYIQNTKKYSEIALIGFSLGGNLVLKYLGEESSAIDSVIKCAAVVSVPCCLKSSSDKLAENNNHIYMQRFIRSLKKKIKNKYSKFPQLIDIKKFENIKTFHEFDNLYTAPYHGFTDAEDYWQQCSSKSFIAAINIPTLIINALDDPFFGEECYPIQQADSSKFVFLETPKYGGHVGFTSFNKENEYWHETRIRQFVLENIDD